MTRVSPRTKIQLMIALSSAAGVLARAYAATGCTDYRDAAIDAYTMVMRSGSPSEREIVVHASKALARLRGDS